MSLINDALKRAKEAQQQHPPSSPSGPPLRPVERRHGRGGNLWLVVAFVIVLAGSIVLLLQWAYQRGRQSRNAAVSVPGQTVVTEAPRVAGTNPGQALPAAAVLRVETKPTPTVPPARPEARPATQVSIAHPAPVATTTAPSNAMTQTMTSAVSVATAAPPVIAEAPPQPVLKLQGIVYHPTRPSAFINGKVLFLGDRIADFRVVAIDSESVTLVNGGKTNVLSLQ